MNINDKLMKTLELFKNATMIEISPLSYRKLEDNVLEHLEKTNIKIIIKENIKEFKIYSYKLDCFAYKNKECEALREIDCIGCKFYKNKKVFL